MKKAILFFALGLIVGILTWKIVDKLESMYVQGQMDRYLTYYDEFEFSKTLECLEFNVKELETIPLVDPNQKRCQINTKSSKIVLVTLCATWCVPFTNELNRFEQLQSHCEGKLELYFLSSEPAASLKKFTRTKQTNLPFYSYPSEAHLPAYLQRGLLPLTLMLYNGSVVFEHFGAAPWDSEKIIQLIERLTRVELVNH